MKAQSLSRFKYSLKRDYHASQLDNKKNLPFNAINSVSIAKPYSEIKIKDKFSYQNTSRIAIKYGRKLYQKETNVNQVNNNVTSNQSFVQWNQTMNQSNILNTADDS